MGATTTIKTMAQDIYEQIKKTEEYLAELREIKKRYDNEPMLYLEDKIQEMRFSNKVSSKDIISAVIEHYEKWKK
jgi:hypothetical protein